MDFPKSVPNIGLVNGEFVDENTATGQPGSLIPTGWGNAVTHEIMNAIKAGGLDPAEGNVSQLADVVKAKVNGDFIVDAGFISDDPSLPYFRRKTDGLLYRLQRALGAASETVLGFIGIATQAEVTAGTNDTKAVTPKKLAQKTAGYILGDTASVVGFVSGSKTAPYILHADSTIVRVALPAATLAGYGIGDAYTKSQVDQALSQKAASSSTLAGYGILDAYTKAQTDSALSFKPNADAITDVGFVSNDITKPYMRRASDGLIYRLQAALGNATEAALGILAIATQAVTNAGVDDSTAVTPKKLKAGTSYLFAANGYIVLPVWLGGFIIQWGNANIGDDTVVDITLPLTFPNSFFAAVATAQIGSAVTGANSLSATAFKKNLSIVAIGMNQGSTSTPATSGVDFICIGR